MAVQCKKDFVIPIKDKKEVKESFPIFKVSEIIKARKMTELEANSISNCATKFIIKMDNMTCSCLEKARKEIDAVGALIGKGNNKEKIDINGSTVFTNLLTQKLSVSKLVSIGFPIWDKRGSDKKGFHIFTSVDQILGNLLRGNLPSIAKEFIDGIFVKGSKYLDDIRNKESGINLDSAFAVRVATFIWEIIFPEMNSFDHIRILVEKSLKEKSSVLKMLQKETPNYEKAQKGIIDQYSKEITQLCKDVEAIAKQRSLLAQEVQKLVNGQFDGNENKKSDSPKASASPNLGKPVKNNKEAGTPLVTSTSKEINSQKTNGSTTNFQAARGSANKKGSSNPKETEISIKRAQKVNPLSNSNTEKNTDSPKNNESATNFHAAGDSANKRNYSNPKKAESSIKDGQKVNTPSDSGTAKKTNLPKDNQSATNSQKKGTDVNKEGSPNSKNKTSSDNKKTAQKGVPSQQSLPHGSSKKNQTSYEKKGRLTSSTKNQNNAKINFPSNKAQDIMAQSMNSMKNGPVKLRKVVNKNNNEQADSTKVNHGEDADWLKNARKNLSKLPDK